ncbi:annexin A7 [Patella vulgata]|uniref:annexin A7 n=1 Tax=Patella vulgata TaxID=6465 RepID=UPI00218064CD|nr:annexin A7 [Patella vulgata]
MPGTIRKNYDFDVAAITESLRDSMAGWGTDEEQLISTIVGFNNEQRLEIAQSFKAAYGKELIEDLKSELKGDFEEICVAMFEHPRMYDAKQIHNAMTGVGTDETTIIEIMCTRSNDEINEIKEKYKEEVGNELEDDLQGETSGYFERLLVSLCAAGRDDKPGVDYEQATEDAQKFYEAGAAVWGTEEAELNAILCLRSHQQLRQTMIHYENLTGCTMEETIDSECDGSLQNGYLAIVESTKNMPGYFARRLKESFEGLGTKDTDLIRIIVSRSEIDLQEIKEAYAARYETALSDAIASECGGDYNRMLLAIVNAE